MTEKKLFREEAKLESVQCLGCGGPVALHGFGAVQRVVCPHCGSTLEPEEGGALSLLQKAARAHQPSALQLHARGKLDGATWEVIGICWRRCVVDGVAYPWQEFFLYNPYKGYRWLIYSMSDGHWSLGQTLTAAPRILDTKHHSIEHKGRRYKHFQGADAVVTYVEGEFTWQVQVGDAAHVDDFVAPPWGISVEQAAGPDGVELTRTLQRHVDPKELDAFGPADVGKPHGVGALQPNHWYAQTRALWLSCLGFSAAAVLITWVSAGAATEREVFLKTDVAFDAPLSAEVTIGTPGSHTSVEVSFTAQPLENSWAFAEVMLVNLETEEAVGVGLEASYYHGWEDGGWSEGDIQPDQIIGRVPGGRYLLQVNPQRDTSALPGAYSFSVSLSGVPRSPETYSVRLREDVFLTRYPVLAFLVILLFPLLAQLLGAAFERRRWQNSDYGT